MSCGLRFLVVSLSFGLAAHSVSASDEPSTQQLAAYRNAWIEAVQQMTPDGYRHEELYRCAGCHETAMDEDGNSTHRNAIGITGDPLSPTLTGKGWLSGAHGRSQDSVLVSNTYCAWCHAPSQPGVTNHIAAAVPIGSGRTGVSCIACHASDAVDEKFGTYQANFRPGGDRDSLVDFVPRQPASGIETNEQCLFCHLLAHPFAAGPHANLVEKGDLRCIDCHMAVYNITGSGRRERYHNMKVAANEDPATCGPCHDFEPAEISIRCQELVPSFSSVVHAVPTIE